MWIQDDEHKYNMSIHNIYISIYTWAQSMWYQCDVVMISMHFKYRSYHCHMYNICLGVMTVYSSAKIILNLTNGPQDGWWGIGWILLKLSYGVFSSLLGLAAQLPFLHRSWTCQWRAVGDCWGADDSFWAKCQTITGWQSPNIKHMEFTWRTSSWEMMILLTCESMWC